MDSDHIEVPETEAVVSQGQEEQEKDSIKISSEVIAIIVGLVSGDIEGIAGMSGGLVGGIAEKLGKKDLTKGIKVTVEDEIVAVDMNVIAEYGVSIVEAANRLKKAIRDSVEKTTGFKVKTININVLGINIPGNEEAEKPTHKKKEEPAE